MIDLTLKEPPKKYINHIKKLAKDYNKNRHLYIDPKHFHFNDNEYLLSLMVDKIKEYLLKEKVMVNKIDYFLSLIDVSKKIIFN